MMTLVSLCFPVLERLQHFTRLQIGDCDRIQVRSYNQVISSGRDQYISKGEKAHWGAMMWAHKESTLVERNTVSSGCGLKREAMLRTKTCSLEMYLLRWKVSKNLVFILCMQEFCKQIQDKFAVWRFQDITMK